MHLHILTSSLVKCYKKKVILSNTKLKFDFFLCFEIYLSIKNYIKQEVKLQIFKIYFSIILNNFKRILSNCNL